jgi:3-hydroxyisobutyrate dehydrogenase
MGSGMARSLLRADFPVRGYDVRHSAMEAVQAAGLQPTGSSADAGAGADVALVVVLNADQAEEAIFGPTGLAKSLARNTVVICATTMAVARARVLAERAGDAGLAWLDAPISGGTTRAEQGTLTSMVGGDATDLARVRPVLDAYSRDVFHLGPVGAGSGAKLINQVLVYCNLAAAAEAMTLCRKLGVDGQAVYDVITTAMGASAIFDARVPHILDGSYRSGGSLRIALKDLGIVEDSSREVGMPMFMTAQAAQLFRAVAAQGSLDRDDLAVAQFLERIAGLSD